MKILSALLLACLFHPSFGSPQAPPVDSVLDASSSETPQMNKEARILWERIRNVLNTKFEDLTDQKIVLTLGEYFESNSVASSAATGESKFSTKFTARDGLPFELYFTARRDQIKIFGFNWAPVGRGVLPEHCVPIAALNQDLRSSGWRLTSENRFEGAAASNFFTDTSGSVRIFLAGGCAVSLVRILAPNQ